MDRYATSYIWPWCRSIICVMTTVAIRPAIVTVRPVVSIITVVPSVIPVCMSYTLIISMTVCFINSFLLFILMPVMTVATSLGTCIITHKQSEKRDNGYPENVLFHKKNFSPLIVGNNHPCARIYI